MNRSYYQVINIATISSPSLLYFRKHIEGNLDKMVEIAGGPELAPRRLRPHIKTFKTMGVVELLRSRGITKFKCATIAEAEMLAAAGITDILLAYPAVGPSIDRLVALTQAFPGARIKVLGDNPVVVGELSRALAAVGSSVEVLVDIDPGLHRTGVLPEQAPNLVKIIAEAPGTAFGGLHFYDGHNHQHDFEERLSAARDGYDAVVALERQLASAGYEVPRVVMGGTPTFPCYAQLGDTELSPGTCAIHDWGYSREMPDLPFVPGGLVLGRVVSHPEPPSGSPPRFTVDVGSKAICTDRPGQRGLILGYESARPVMQNEEHWVWELAAESGAATAAAGQQREAPGAKTGAAGSPAAAGVSSSAGPKAGAAIEAPPIGAELLIVPEHICPTTAHYDEVVVIGPDGSIEGTWEVTARKRRLGV